MENEKRLIELGEALRMVQNSKEDCPETSIKGRAIWTTAHNCALSCLTSCSTVDAVEVVRCKDCKYFCPYEGEEHKGDCAELVGLESCVYEDDFCSNGERKDNEH